MSKAYYQTHREACIQRTREWRDQNPEKVKLNRKREPELVKRRLAKKLPHEREALRFLFAQQKKRHSLRKKIAALWWLGGALCWCCGERDIRFLTVDHLNNDGKSHRQLLIGTNFARDLCSWILDGHVEEALQGNLRPSCYNCNLARAHYGTCPHQDEMSLETLLHWAEKHNRS